MSTPIHSPAGAYARRRPWLPPATPNPPTLLFTTSSTLGMAAFAGPPTARAAHSASSAARDRLQRLFHQRRYLALVSITGKMAGSRVAIDLRGHGEGETCTRVNSDVELVGEMQKRGIVPDVVTFNILMDGLSRDGKVVEACLLLELLVKRGYEPNVVTFCTLVKGLLGTEQLLQALQLHR